jgi:hypothetical protein
MGVQIGDGTYIGGAHPASASTVSNAARTNVIAAPLATLGWGCMDVGAGDHL